MASALTDLLAGSSQQPGWLTLCYAQVECSSDVVVDVTHCASLGISRVKMVLKHSWVAPSSTRYT